MSWVPLVVELPGSFRQSSPCVERLRTNSPLLEWNHFSFEPPLQAQRITLVPLPPLPWSFTHLPLCLISPPENENPWAESELLHDQMMTLAPFAELLPLSSRHLPPYPLTTELDPDPDEDVPVV